MNRHDAIVALWDCFVNRRTIGRAFVPRPPHLQAGVMLGLLVATREHGPGPRPAGPALDPAAFARLGELGPQFGHLVAAERTGEERHHATPRDSSPPSCHQVGMTLQSVPPSRLDSMTSIAISSDCTACLKFSRRGGIET